MGISFVEHFSELQDPRIDRKKRHKLMDILVLTVCAVISGADGWESIVQFGHDKLDWLRRLVPLANGIPSPDCIAYLYSRLSPVAFRDCFLRWAESLRERFPEEIIAVDGKTARGSHDRAHGQCPIHTVSAWAGSHRLVLGQELTETKSNEITAIPKLLELLVLEGCIITLDAMGCQTAIATQIIDQGGDYVMGLKGNQSTLHEAVEDYFTVAHATDFRAVRYNYQEELDHGHGRLEIRRYWITDDLSTLPELGAWKQLRSIGMVERETQEGGNVSRERRYFIASLPPEAKRFAYAVRGHWGVENELHWRLDVVFREDESRIRQGNAPAIMTAIRHLCLNLFQKESSKMSIKKKRLKAAWNDDFRYKVLMA